MKYEFTLEEAFKLNEERTLEFLHVYANKGFNPESMLIHNELKSITNMLAVIARSLGKPKKQSYDGSI